MPNQTNYCWTLNNYTDADKEALGGLPSDSVRYTVVGFETASTGTRHLQGFTIFHKRLSVTGAKGVLTALFGHSRCHVEACKGSAKTNYEYCTKSGQFREFGVRPARGEAAHIANRERSLEVIELARRSEWDTIKEDYPDMMLRFWKTLKQMELESFNTTRNIDMILCTLFHGATGTGKSKAAHLKRPFVKDIETDWWDGYAGQDVVLFDDVTPQWMTKTYQKVLRWCDHYAFPAPVKGGYMTIRPSEIIFTSNYDLEQLIQFVPLQTQPALRRRIKEQRFETQGPEVLEEAGWTEVETKLDDSYSSPFIEFDSE